MVINKTRKYPKKHFSSISSLRVTQSIFVRYPNPAKFVFHDHFAAMLEVGVWECMHKHTHAHPHARTSTHARPHMHNHTTVCPEWQIWE